MRKTHRSKRDSRNRVIVMSDSIMASLLVRNVLRPNGIENSWTAISVDITRIAVIPEVSASDCSYCSAQAMSGGYETVVGKAGRGVGDC